MTADIRESANMSVIAMDNDDRLIANLERDIVARTRHLFRTPDADTHSRRKRCSFSSASISGSV